MVPFASFSYTFLTIWRQMEEIKGLLRKKEKKDYAGEPRNRTVTSLGGRATFEGV